MQNTGKRNHHSWPALYVALLLTLGILPGYRYGLPILSVDVAVVCLLLLSLAVAGLLVHLQRRTSPWLSLLGAALTIGTGSVLGCAVRSEDVPMPDVSMRTPVTVIGTILDPPSRSGNALRFRCAISAVIADTQTQNISTTALVALRRHEPGGHPIVPEYGMVVALHGVLEYPRPARNPGEFNAQEFFHANGIAMLLSVKGDRHVCVLDSTGGWWGMRRVVVPVRMALLAHIDQQIGGEEGEFLKGLMIGERGGLDPPLQHAFLVTGVAHILAVSGSNVAVVAAAFMAILLLLRIPRRIHAFPVAGVLLFYMMLTGSQSSVVRATIMALVALVVAGRGVRGCALNAVGIAALIMYAIDPRQLFDMGFQLSFAAVLSIVLLYPRVNRHISAWKGNSRIRRLARGGLRLGAVSLVASVGTFPLTASAFGQVSLIGLLANIVVVPASGWSVVLGLLSATVEMVSANAAGSLCALNALTLSFTLAVVRACAMFPFAAVQTHWFDPLWALPFVGILGMVHSAGDRSLFRSWFLFVLAGANVPLYIAGRSSGEPGVLTVTVVDVGQGDAILIEHPDGGAVLIDTGPVPFDARSGLVPFLQRWGIEELDVVIITHPHDDHAGGLPTLRAAMPVRRLITHATAKPGSMIPWKEDCRLQILYAVAVGMGAGTPEEEPNRLSVVVRLVYGNTTFLFAADAEQIEEDRMIAAYGAGLASAVLKVGHHGSRLGTTAAWLDAVRPTHALISVGSKNRFGHPSDAVLRRLRGRNISVARTDEDGAIMMISDGQTVRRFLWR